MRIAQVAPLVESVPPQFYGGTERVVGYLTEELVRRGHEVTLFASGDSVTSARLRPMCGSALRLDPGCSHVEPHHLLTVEKVRQAASSFDIIHFHTDLLHFSCMRQQSTSFLTTLHGRLDLQDVYPLYREFADLPFVSISDAQRAPLPWLNWNRTVHHGLPEDLLSFGTGAGGYLAFLGRIAPEKRPDRAIRIAKAAGMKLKIAAKIDRVDQQYFNQAIRPLLCDPLVDFVGEIRDSEKSEFLGNASALLFPIDWPEPFGLVMIEAMACGTPTIAFRCGSVAEVLSDGISGIVVDSEQEAVRACHRIGVFDRAAIRRVFLKRFSASRMAQDYLAVYRDIMEESKPPLRAA